MDPHLQRAPFRYEVHAPPYSVLARRVGPGGAHRLAGGRRPPVPPRAVGRKPNPAHFSIIFRAVLTTRRLSTRISATESNGAAPARSTGRHPRRLGSAKIFSGASESRGASNGRTSGQLFLADHVPNCQHNVRWIARPSCFPAHHPVAVGHAMALRLSTERVTVWRQWPQL